jgi:hypothetical protein
MLGQGVKAIEVNDTIRIHSTLFFTENIGLLL